MKNVTVCSILAAALVFPITVRAEDHAWVRDREDGRVSTSASVPLSFESHFTLSPSQLNLCSVSASAITQIDLTGAPGVDLIGRADSDLRSLLAPAAFKANAALLSGEPGRDLTNPEEFRKLGRSVRPAADISIDGDEVNLRLQIFRGAGACAPSKMSAGGLGRITAAAEADSCSGACDCTFCVCEGSESCCEAGCDGCWEYRDDAGLCGPA